MAVNTCDTCGGEGRITIAPSYPPGASFYDEDCDDCGGTGEIEEDDEMTKPAPRTREYIGNRADHAGAAKVIIAHGPVLDPRNDVINHSPDGFQWGYSGSGPAQLALALLCDVLGGDEHAAELATKLHQEFKAEKIATITGDHWVMTASEIRDWIASKAPPCFRWSDEEEPVNG